ncbi:MAG: ABC-type transport auxiliary lipoprotein family protein [Steroidobacteraceae bacterium]
MRIGVMVSVLAATLLAGCSLLKRGEEPDRVYILRAEPGSQGAPAVPGVLLLLRPVIQPGLDNDRIALLRGDNELNHFAGSRWSEPLPRVLSAFAVESLAGGGGFTTVVAADRVVVNSDFELLLTVRHFEAQYSSGEAPVIQVTFDCVVTAGAPRKVIGRCDSAVTEPVASNRMGEIVPALERATRKAIAEVRTKAVAAAQGR